MLTGTMLTGRTLTRHRGQTAGSNPHSLRPIDCERVQKEDVQHPLSRAELFDVPPRKRGGILSRRRPDVDDLPHIGNQAAGRKSAAGRGLPFYLRIERPLVAFARQQRHGTAGEVGLAVGGHDRDGAVRSRLLEHQRLALGVAGRQFGLQVAIAADVRRLQRGLDSQRYLSRFFDRILHANSRQRPRGELLDLRNTLDAQRLPFSPRRIG